MLNHVHVPVDPAKILQDLGKFLSSFRTYKVKKGSWTTFFLVVNHGLPQIKHSILHVMYLTCRNALWKSCALRSWRDGVLLGQE